MVSGAAARLNDWNPREVQRAETTWGDKLPQYTLDMFDFAIAKGGSYLDLACGFGRFLKYLDERVEEPDYIGYDSSEAMVKRNNENHPDYFNRVFHKDITDPIKHPQESIIASAVFIHITLADQQRILNNILRVRPFPKAITFDINCPCESAIDRLKIKRTEHYERIIKTTKDGTSTFRMTWQSHHALTSRLLSQFEMYNITVKFYDLHNNQHKVVYFLEKK